MSSDVLTEDSVAMDFAAKYAGKLHYCHTTGCWFEFAGSHWRREEKKRAFHYSRVLARDRCAGAKARTKQNAGRASFANGVERFAQADTRLSVTADAWDSDPYLLATPGGTVDLRTGELRAAKPEDMITRVAATTPAKIAKCPRWDQFLIDATKDDSDTIRFLKGWCGYCLTGDTKEQNLIFLHGNGGNGKGVFINTVQSILGTYAVVAAMDTFTQSGGDKHPTDLAMLAGARMVTASETEEGRAWAEARIKSLTGGDPITARFMRRDFFTFTPTFKLTVVGNHKPLLNNVDDAARRRFNIVNFHHKPSSPDPDLLQKLKAEWPGILRWMIDGCLEWQRHGLQRPESVTQATAEYFEAQDLFGQWLADECECDVAREFRTEPSKTLFASWSAYAGQAGERAGSRKKFAEALQRSGIFPVKGTGGARMFKGIRLKPISQDGARWD